MPLKGCWVVGGLEYLYTHILCVGPTVIRSSNCGCLHIKGVVKGILVVSQVTKSFVWIDPLAYKDFIDVLKKANNFPQFVYLPII